MLLLLWWLGKSIARSLVTTLWLLMRWNLRLNLAIRLRMGHRYTLRNSITLCSDSLRRWSVEGVGMCNLLGIRILHRYRRLAMS